MFARIASKPSLKREAFAAYADAVERARNPVFYTECAVPDTLDGRFEMIVLQLFLLFKEIRAQEGERGETRIRLISEAFFYDMDRNLRELGVSDTGVGKRIKKMVEAFYGRLKAYDAAWKNPQVMEAALAKNVYGGADKGQSARLRLMITA